MTLNKRRKKGGGRKKLKREGALKDQPVGLKVYGDTVVEKLEGLLIHRESNLRRAKEKGYPRSALRRYEGEVEDAKRQLERAVTRAIERRERRIERKNKEAYEKLLELKERLDRKTGRD